MLDYKQGQHNWDCNQGEAWPFQLQDYSQEQAYLPRLLKSLQQQVVEHTEEQVRQLHRLLQEVECPFEHNKRAC